jgi:hypothetical protein
MGALTGGIHYLARSLFGGYTNDNAKACMCNITKLFGNPVKPMIPPICRNVDAEPVGNYVKLYTLIVYGGTVKIHWMIVFASKYVKLAIRSAQS